MQVISLNGTYASGGRRLVAWVIDSIIISTVLTIAFWWLPDPGGRTELMYTEWMSLNIRMWFEHIGTYKVVKFTLATIYFALMESSIHQATIGKLALGVKVTDHNGERISFSKALLRNLSKFISWLILCIGYIMIVFDDKKQGLHDKIADTYVVRN